MGASSEKDWWRQAVIYQIYPRSFADDNGDGIGDLLGVTSRVPYLVSLGVDAVWLSPFYPSALKDGGYDVSDYRHVDPRIGTLADFDDMVRALKHHNIKVMVDIVPNHTSDEHEWFRAAVTAGKGSAEREKYIFKRGLGPNADQPPTDWQAQFGGPAWSPSGTNDGEWYFHMFSPSQPDLDWRHPAVRADFLHTLRFWGDRGVAGFRIDVAHGLAKDMSGVLPSWGELVEMSHRKLRSGNASLVHPILDRDEVHGIYRDWRKVFDEYDPPLVAVAECWVAPDRKHLYASADGLGQAFSFDILLCNFQVGEYRRCIENSLESSRQAGSSTTWVLSNHDMPRHASRFGMPDLPKTENHTFFMAGCNQWLLAGFPGLDLETGTRRARAATLMILGLPGSTYIYQGEELGLPEVTDIPPEQRQDPTFHRTHGREVGRDGCRLPLPWISTAPNFGFTPPHGAAPHLPQPPSFGALAVDVEERHPRSTLDMYRAAIHLRKELIGEEELCWVEEKSQQVLHFARRGGWHVLMNGGKEGWPLSEQLRKGEVLIASSVRELSDGVLPGETTVWIRMEE